MHPVAMGQSMQRSSLASVRGSWRQCRTALCRCCLAWEAFLVCRRSSLASCSCERASTSGSSGLKHAAVQHLMACPRPQEPPTLHTRALSAAKPDTPHPDHPLPDLHGAACRQEAVGQGVQGAAGRRGHAGAPPLCHVAITAPAPASRRTGPPRRGPPATRCLTGATSAMAVLGRRRGGGEEAAMAAGPGGRGNNGRRFPFCSDRPPCPPVRF